LTGRVRELAAVSCRVACGGDHCSLRPPQRTAAVRPSVRPSRRVWSLSSLVASPHRLPASPSSSLLSVVVVACRCQRPPPFSPFPPPPCRPSVWPCASGHSTRGQWGGGETSRQRTVRAARAARLRRLGGASGRSQQSSAAAQILTVTRSATAHCAVMCCCPQNRRVWFIPALPAMTATMELRLCLPLRCRRPPLSLCSARPAVPVAQ